MKNSKRIPLILMGAFLAVSAAVVVPNLWNAVQRNKQKESMAGLHAWDDAIRSYGVKHGFPRLGSPEERREFARSSHLPLEDGWGNAFSVVVTGTGYTIRSFGWDGTPDRSERDGPARARRRAIREFRSDLVMRDGEWLQWPEGL